MKLIEEMVYDLDFSMPRVIITGRTAILENIKSIEMISERSLTVSSRYGYTTVTGEDFIMKEIGEGRIIIEGSIERVEFLPGHGHNKD